MSERFIEMVLIAEDAAHIRQERLAGDPDRDPDETTLEDVTEALLRRQASPEQIMDLKEDTTRLLRIMLKNH